MCYSPASRERERDIQVIWPFLCCISVNFKQTQLPVELPQLLPYLDCIANRGAWMIVLNTETCDRVIVKSGV